MRLKDVNTTDLYATDTGSLARVVMTGQLFSQKNFSRDSFPFRHVSTGSNQGRVGEGRHGYVVGHLIVAHWGHPSKNDETRLAELKIPEVDSELPESEQFAILREFAEYLEAQDTDYRLSVSNTKRMKLWSDHIEARRREHEKWKRERDESDVRRKQTLAQFDELSGELIHYGFSDLDVRLARATALAEAYREESTIHLSLNTLATILVDAKLGRSFGDVAEQLAE